VYIRTFRYGQRGKHFHEILHFLHLINDDIIGGGIPHLAFYPIQQVIGIPECLVLPALHIDDEDMI